MIHPSLAWLKQSSLVQSDRSSVVAVPYGSARNSTKSMSWTGKAPSSRTALFLLFMALALASCNKNNDMMQAIEINTSDYLSCENGTLYIKWNNARLVSVNGIPFPREWKIHYCAGMVCGSNSGWYFPKWNGTTGNESYYYWPFVDANGFDRLRDFYWLENINGEQNIFLPWDELEIDMGLVENGVPKTLIIVLQ